MAEDAGRDVRRLEHGDEPQALAAAGARQASSSNTRRSRSAHRQPRFGLDTEPADGDSSGIALMAGTGACGTTSCRHAAREAVTFH